MSQQLQPKIVGPGEGLALAITGDLTFILASGEDTGGKYALFDVTVPPGGGPPPHVHSRELEAFYVLEGEIEFTVAGKASKGSAGTFVSGPPGIPHRFQNVGAKAARMLVLVTPAGLEKFFLEVGTVVNPKDPIPPLDEARAARVMEIAPKYGIEIFPPS